MTEWTEKLADRVSEAFGEQTLIPDEVKAVLWDINSEAWQRGILWSRFNGSVPPPSEANPYRKPPLVLPTEPTWGIVRCLYDPTYRLIHAALDDRGYRFGDLVVENIVDFIPVPLTDEQVQRIEAAR